MTDQRASVKAGRPRKYNPKLARDICARLTAGESLRRICRDDGMPAMSTVMLWNLDNEGGFSEQYAKARRAQAEQLMDELLDISDDGSNDFMAKLDEEGQPTGGYMVNHENIARSRLRVDTRKWYASKVLPKIYGDKQIHQTQEGDDGPLTGIKFINVPVKPGIEESEQ